MRRLILDQIRHRPGRAAALAAGILVAAVSFSLVNAAHATPKRQDLVRDNYLSGIFGGITMAQYQKIKKIPGVEIAAPIAMIGYVLETVAIPIDVTAALTDAPAQVLSLSDQRVADLGLTRFPAESMGYVYVTPDPLKSNVTGSFTVAPGVTIGLTETLPDGSPVTVCP